MGSGLLKNFKVQIQSEGSFQKVSDRRERTSMSQSDSVFVTHRTQHVEIECRIIFDLLNVLI